MDLLLLLSDRLDLPTARRWRGSVGEIGMSVAKRCQTCAICSALSRACAFESVDAIARHCCARRRYSCALPCVTAVTRWSHTVPTQWRVRRSEIAHKSAQWLRH